MARDYKRKPVKKTSGSSPWLFLAYGFALGLIAALALYLHLRTAEPEAPDRPVPNAATSPQSSSNSENEPATTTATVNNAPVKAANPPPPAPVDRDFAFYDELRKFEVVIFGEDDQPVAAKPSAPRPNRPVETPGKPATYMLQAGSFRKFVDADRRKAELAFKGIESNIQRVVLEQDEVWYRVYVGPGTDFAAFENIRSELRRANIDVLILKVLQ